jgi:hypothetical protein
MRGVTDSTMRMTPGVNNLIVCIILLLSLRKERPSKSDSKGSKAERDHTIREKDIEMLVMN